MTALQGIDQEPLTRWWAETIPDSKGPLELSLIKGGHSNLTFHVKDGNGRSFALRRPPLGPQPPGAHDMLREHKVLAALQPTGARVPPVAAVCADTAVIGAPFYVMSWVDGFMVDRAASVPQVLPDPVARATAAFSLIDCLAQLHQLDVDAIGLGNLGPRENYLPRQLKRMRAVWDKTKTRELPIIEELHGRLLARMPPQRYTGLVHADYRLGNTIFSRDYTVKAVLDWELCALGDVLSDVGALLANWDLPEDDWPDVWMERAPTRAGGFPDRGAIAARYAARTGFDVTALDYYRAFSYWRIAVVAEGMKRRYEAGAMGGNVSDVGKLDVRVRRRADLADRFLTLAER